MKYNSKLENITYSILFVIGSLIALFFNSYITVTILLLIANLGILTSYYYWNNKVIDFFIVFYFFFILYALSGPISLNVFGELNNNFLGPFYQKQYLFIVILLTIIILFSVIAMSSKTKVNLKSVYFSKQEIFITIFISFLLEVINIEKLGGISTLFIGKSQYQSLISEVGGLYPSFEIFIYAFIMIMVMIFKKIQFSKREILMLIILSSPAMFSKIVLGSRSSLLRLLIIALVIASFYGLIKFNFKSISKIVSIIFIFTIFFSYDSREALSNIANDGNLNSYFSTVFSKQNISNSVNLGKNEFGFTYGNYNEFFKKYGNNHDLEPTFLEGIVSVIPSSMLKNEKPTQIVYRFRDEFFPERANYGRISSTGFSAILEGHINAGPIGSVLYYSTLIFASSQAKWLLRVNKYGLLYYLSLLNVAQRIHRISFGDTLGMLIQQMIPLVVVFLTINIFHIFSKNKEIV